MAISRITRRQSLMRLAAAGAAPAPRRNPLDGGALYADVAAYAALGEHRTATTADVKTSHWLTQQLESAGYRARLMPFRLEQFFPRKTELKVAGQVLPSFPLWWPHPTGSSPLRGALGGNIALVKLPEVRAGAIMPGDPVHQAIETAIRAGAAAIVAIVPSPSGEILTLNVRDDDARWPIPIVLAADSDRPRLERWAAAAAPASVLVDGAHQKDAAAYEVIARLERGRPFVLVTTPSSGWFRCAGERGPGIALWLGLARWAAQRKSPVTYEFVASSGHELDGMGLREFMRREPPSTADMLCWLHLGAGIATYDYKRTERGLEKLAGASPLRKLYCTERFKPLLQDAFAALPDLSPATDRPLGEMILMAEKGYPYFGFAGGSVFHHAPGDLPERITGPELLEPVAQSLVKALTAIESRVGFSLRGTSVPLVRTQ
jgi:hypothetical protein